MKKEINLMGYSVLVDNEEQAKKLQEYAFKQGFKWSSDKSKELKYLHLKSFQFGILGDKNISKLDLVKHYQDENITKQAHYNDLFPEEKETPQQEIERLKARILELENELPKVGDICVCDNGFYKFIVTLTKEDSSHLNPKPLPTELQEQLKKYL